MRTARLTPPARSAMLSSPSRGVRSMPQSSKYRILHELGAGGMGTIHKGLLIGEAGFQRPIVIKQLRHADDTGHLQLFVDEARRYAVLDHENIGRIFDFDRVGEQLCIILEYIDGWSLVEYLDRHRELSRFPDVELSVFIVSRVCRALQYVFEKASIVHRDISPSNIMMTREGTVKLIDFGIATRSGTRDSTLTGKPAYMAPEMVLEMRADNRSDLFSLGAVFFEMLTRERLFSGKGTAQVLEQVIAGHNPSPRAYNPDIPDGVMVLLKKALQRDPARRFSSAGEMGEACEHFLYDKGYGPTNLTLKSYVNELFPASAAEPLPTILDDVPLLDPTLIPLEGGSSQRVLTGDDPTPVSPFARTYAERAGSARAPQPGDDGPGASGSAETIRAPRPTSRR
jgi:eukaryotic-like serine/threonine-protein kinase